MGLLLDIYNLGHGVEDGDFEWWEWFGLHPIKRFWRRKMASLIMGFVGNPESVLNMGCGSSPFSNSFNCSLVGVDINRDKLDFISKRSNHKFLVGDIRTFRLDSGFDCIICSEVLEHISRDELPGTVENICSMVSGNGRVIVASPDYSVWVGRILENLFHSYHYDFRFDYLDSLFSEFGFKRTGTGRWLWDTVVLYER